MKKSAVAFVEIKRCSCQIEAGDSPCEMHDCKHGESPEDCIECAPVLVKFQGGRRPVYATEGSAGFDITAVEDCEVNEHTAIRIQTGLRVEIPPGYEIQIRPRSSLSANGVHMAFGTIDSDYRGEISAVAWCLPGAQLKARLIHKGDRIAQGVLAKVERAQFMEADKLSETARGEGGFGSTGR